MKANTSPAVRSLFIFILVLAAGAMTSLAAEEEPKVRVCLVPPVDLSGAIDLDYSTIFYDALRAELVASDFELVERETVEAAVRELGYKPEDLLSAPKLMELSRRVKAGVAVGGFLQADREDFILGLQGYQVGAGRSILSMVRRGQVGLGIYVLVNESSGEFIGSLRTKVAALPPGSVTVTSEKIVENVTQVDMLVELGKRVKVSLLLDQDAEVFLGDEPLGRPKEGRLETSTQAKSNLVLMIKKEGYHERRIVEFVGEEPKEIRIEPLRQKIANELALEYSSHQFLGAGLVYRYHWIPQTVFLKLSNYLYFQVAPTGLQNSNIIPHYDFSATAGLKLFGDPGGFFRFGLSAGPGFVLTMVPLETGPRLFTDVYILPDLWFEFDFRWFKLYLETFAKVGTNLFTNLQGTRMFTNNFPQFSVGAVWKQW